MDSNRFFRPRALLACVPLLAALGMAGAAHAQYSWIDEHGTHVFSDRPPPPGTPPARILKTPKSAVLPAREAAAPAPAASPAAGPVTGPAGTAAVPAAAPSGPPSLADRDAEFRKRMAQRDADEHKAADDAKNKAALAAQCASARRSAAALSSGARITDVDGKGERVVLTDEEKARRLAESKQALADCR